MRNEWADGAAAAMVEKYSGAGVGADIALRVYTSRLIGKQPHLVIHGGGNTSVKTRVADFFGRSCDVLCVKGSGWNLDTIEPAGLPALHLAPLIAVRARTALSDEEMVSFLRSNLLDASSPNPSVETLLHAFLPHRFVDHSHATAILALSDQPQGERLLRDALGDKVAVFPYVMPGFALAKAVADAFEAAPAVEGVVLQKHGLFTFGATARESYDRMIDIVTRAEHFIDAAPAFAPAPRRASVAEVPPGEIAPIVRGAAALDHGGGARTRFLAEFRVSDAIRRFIDGADVADYGARGVVTPDHVIRTKNRYLVAPAPASGDLSAFRSALVGAAATYRRDYDAYFASNDQRLGGGRKKLDAAPRVVLVPGVGLFGLGKTMKDARIAADLAEITIDTIAAAERVGRFEPLPPEDIFEMEYWSLEQAKLGKQSARPLEGQIAVITGGAGAIGAATARLFAKEGAAVAILDIDADAATKTARAIGGDAIGLACDVTDLASVQSAYASVVAAFGGVDILVSNAGAAYQGPIAELDEAVLRRSFELNFFAHQKMAQAAVAIMKKQGSGGALLFNVSKQAINPGENFGAYGLPKAASLFLVRQYALECARDGVRANAVNADRIRSGILTNEMIASRAAARGVAKDAYLKSNLLGLEVTADDVAQAFLHHALSLKTTGDVTTVDGGNVAAMLR